MTRTSLSSLPAADRVARQVIFDMLHECAYVGTPLARTILGPVANIKSISADDIKSYIGTHYTAPRMVFAASGAVEHDQLVDLAAKHFGGVQSEPPPGAAFEDAPSLFTGADVRDYNDDMETAHFALAFEGLKWTDPDIFSLMLCQSLLGTYDAKKSGGELTSAKLASDLAKLDAGVKLMQPFCTCYTDTGLFGVYFEMAMAKKEHVDDTIGTIQEELVALTTGVTDDDLATAKANLKYNLMMQMDGTSPNAEEIGRQMLVYGRRMSLAETFARVDAIEADDVTRVAEKIIWDQVRTMACLSLAHARSVPVHAAQRSPPLRRFAGGIVRCDRPEPQVRLRHQRAPPRHLLAPHVMRTTCGERRERQRVAWGAVETGSLVGEGHTDRHGHPSQPEWRRRERAP